MAHFIPIADERVGVQVKLWNPLRTRAIPERFCGGDSLRRGAISSVCTFTFMQWKTFKTLRGRAITISSLVPEPAISGSWCCAYFYGITPHCKGLRPSTPQFWGSFYVCVHPSSQNYQIWRGNTWGRGVYLGVSHASHRKTAEFQRFPIWGFSCIYAYAL